MYYYLSLNTQRLRDLSLSPFPNDCWCPSNLSLAPYGDVSLLHDLLSTLSCFFDFDIILAPLISTNGGPPLPSLPIFIKDMNNHCILLLPASFLAFVYDSIPHPHPSLSISRAPLFLSPSNEDNHSQLQPSSIKLSTLPPLSPFLSLSLYLFPFLSCSLFNPYRLPIVSINSNQRPRMH